MSSPGHMSVVSAFAKKGEALAGSEQGVKMNYQSNITTRIRAYLCATAALVALIFASSAALRERGEWYPSPWGPDDERGAANRLTPAKSLSQ
jgi:hypothetical protein